MKEQGIDREHVIEGIALAVQMCRLKRADESLEDAVVRFGKEDGVTREEAEKILKKEAA
jgi:hypothetical protein